MGQLVDAVLRRDQLVITETFIRDTTGFVWNTIATRRYECSERASYGVSQGKLVDIGPRGRSDGANRPIVDRRSLVRSPQSGFCGQVFLCPGQGEFGRHDNEKRTRTTAA